MALSSHLSRFGARTIDYLRTPVSGKVVRGWTGHVQRPYENEHDVKSEFIHDNSDAA